GGRARLDNRPKSGILSAHSSIPVDLFRTGRLFTSAGERNAVKIDRALVPCSASLLLTLALSCSGGSSAAPPRPAQAAPAHAPDAKPAAAEPAASEPGKGTGAYPAVAARKTQALRFTGIPSRNSTDLQAKYAPL